MLAPPNPNDSQSWKSFLYDQGYATFGANAQRPDLHPEVYDSRVSTVPGAGVAVWWYQQGAADQKARWPNRGYTHNLAGSENFLAPGRPQELRTWYTGGWINANMGRTDDATAQTRIGDPANAYLLTQTTMAEALAEWQRGVADYLAGTQPPNLEYYDPPGVGAGTQGAGTGIVIQGGTPASSAAGAGGFGSLLSTLLPLFLITRLTQSSQPATTQPTASDAGSYTRGYSDGRNNRTRKTAQNDDYNQGYVDGMQDYYQPAPLARQAQ